MILGRKHHRFQQRPSLSWQWSSSWWSWWMCHRLHTVPLSSMIIITRAWRITRINMPLGAAMQSHRDPARASAVGFFKISSHLLVVSEPNSILWRWLTSFKDTFNTHTHLKTIQSVKILSWKSHSLKAKHSKGRNDVRWFSGTFTNRSPSPTARRSDGGGPTPLEVARFLAVSPENCQRWMDGCHKTSVQMIQKSSSQTPVEV